MNRHRTSRLSRWGGAFALALGPALASAQDGQPPTGPPVTAPQVNDNVRDRGAKAVPPRVTSDVLPPVPATASDPAPPGTRAVRVDAPPASRAPVPGAPAAGNRPARGVHTVEGVVTKIEPAGKDLPQERLRIVLDPTQTWTTFATEGPRDLARRGSRADRDADAVAAEGPAEAGRPFELVIHQRTYVYTFDRSADGTDLLGANATEPEVVESRAGGTRPNVAAALAPKVSNFTNIREGSYLAVRYRESGDLNDALNVSIIRVEEPQTSASGARPAPIPAPAGTTRPGAPSTRVPAVPTNPTGPAGPK